MFENVCGNAVARGFDLAGFFLRCLDRRTGAILTSAAVWVCQRWQLVNKAATFVSVLSSFSVFLSSFMGVMVVDFYLLRKGRIQLNHLYTTYWYTKGVNWRAIPAWICEWAPTIGGLVATVEGISDLPRSLGRLYYMAFLVGSFVSRTVFYLLNLIFPYPGLESTKRWTCLRPSHLVKPPVLEWCRSVNRECWMVLDLNRAMRRWNRYNHREIFVRCRITLSKSEI
jgi:NCS1 family nucleobase:cation symporter-1